mmetsp:Transcript_53528/g.98110  ORF Transcript_53528/g.98110 Transcript_53528/m.98110 type:complete len:309 (-) Transcript_53528:56-982(-)
MGVSGPPPITRNLTSTYARYRSDRRGTRGPMGGLLANDAPDRRLLHSNDGAPDTAIEMATLPPQWVDSATEAREDLKTLNEQLTQLKKAQQKRLLKVFGDDAGPDKEVERISSSIGTLLKRCEQTIHQVKTRGAAAGVTETDAEFRNNVQRSLATQLQKHGQSFRQMQKEYLNDIRKRQRGGMWEEPTNTSSGQVDVGFNDSQLLELEGMESTATQRSEEICQIASSINDLHTIFKELAVLVIDQGTILDRIDYNIESVVHQSQEANKQLQKAEQHQKSNRATKCMLILVLINAIMILVLIFKNRRSN